MGFINNVNVDVRGAAHIAPCTYKTVVLKQNVTKQNLNVLTQAMLDEYGKNTKFVIKWDYVLNNGIIEIPKDCLIDFDGGSISDGTLVGDDTILIYKRPIEEILNVNLDGTFIYDDGQVDKNNNTNGKAKIYLKKDKSFASQLTKDNTIYVIQHDYTLDSDITIPANCVLQFDGGSISGEHTITGNNTGIQAGLVKIFDTDVTLEGRWNAAEAYPEWFGAIGDGTNNDTISFQRIVDTFYGAIIKLRGSYLLGNVLIQKPVNIEGISATNEGTKILAAINGESSSNPNIIFQFYGTHAARSTIKNIHFYGNNKEHNAAIGTLGEFIERDNSGGQLQSEFNAINIYNFEYGLYFKALDTQPSKNVANQFLYFYNLRISYCKSAVKIIGHFGQNNFIDCTFIGSGESHFDVAPGRQNTSGSDIVNLYFDHCSFNGNVTNSIIYSHAPETGSGIIHPTYIFINNCWIEAVTNTTPCFIKGINTVYLNIVQSFFFDINLPLFYSREGGTIELVLAKNKKFSCTIEATCASNVWLNNLIKVLDNDGFLTDTPVADTVIRTNYPYNTKVLIIQKDNTIVENGDGDCVILIGKHGSYSYGIAKIISSDNIGGYYTLGQRLLIKMRNGKVIDIISEKPLIGTTADRTDVIVASDLYEGFMFYDKTLHKQLYWNGTAWVDATGATV